MLKLRLSRRCNDDGIEVVELRIGRRYRCDVEAVLTMRQCCRMIA